MKLFRFVFFVCIKIISLLGKVSNLIVSLCDIVKVVKDKVLGGEFLKEFLCYKFIFVRLSSELID